eukprot:Phypoly_transcript_10060.p1 GENE.Phypoly_transcript_10060~~Phypoly_transcript_10060.p1  ORF type:complete len:377 (+),score=58.60 Phypoly_transcript_10060:159-1289(+)
MVRTTRTLAVARGAVRTSQAQFSAARIVDTRTITHTRAPQRASAARVPPLVMASRTHTQRTAASAALSCVVCVRWMSSAQAKSGNPDLDEAHCTERVRTMDYEHYLCGLFFPRDVRKYYFAVRAFNIELAIIKDVVSSSSSSSTSSPPNIGAMRLDFWRQVINSCYKTPPNPPAHPVARALSSAISECKLSRQWFKNLVDQREKDLVDIQPRTMDELQRYVEGTAGCLNYLALEMLGIKDVKVDHAAVHLGVAEGLVTLLRGTVHHTKHHKIYFPVDLTTKYEVVPESLFNGEIPPYFRDLVFEVASIAKAHLDKSRTFHSSVPSHAIPAFLPSVFVDDFLMRLEKNNFNIFDTQLQTKNHWNLWRILYNNYKQKY